MKDKKPESDLFDRLTTSSLNKYLGKLMEGLTAKFFRTYNASTTLQDQLNKLTEEKSNLHDKLLTYNRANRAVAILCNHQRSIPKTFNKTMENLSERIKSKKKEVKTCKKELKTLKKEKGIPEQKITVKKTKLKRLKDQLHGLKNIITDKEENKQIALGTSKLNYLDPRISVAWLLSCHNLGVVNTMFLLRKFIIKPIEKNFNGQLT
ncbi:hypothetical protein HZS_3715 [Henneguya salminicola]|uniref:DNA topoisomerase n=1 Tax=Henneguya salminicola TaxID=69463 RepID=A0A6G3MEZ0_HENSL|nr:hypothetical protein HZS_3715 [Henneguya salminicola]